VQGRDVAVFFDGSTANKEIESVLVRFLDGNDDIQQCCVGVSVGDESQTAGQLKQMLQDRLGEAAIALKDVKFMVSDSASVNQSAMKAWNDALFRVHPDLGDRTVFPVFCTCHMLSECGAWSVQGNGFAQAAHVWIQKAAQVPTGQEATTGVRSQAVSDNRWWSGLEGLNKKRQGVHGLETFVRRAKEQRCAESAVRKMEQALQQGLLGRLKAEMIGHELIGHAPCLTSPNTWKGTASLRPLCTLVPRSAARFFTPISTAVWMAPSGHCCSEC